MSPKNGHVNMMTDAIIANLPLDGVRSVMRGVLAAHPSLTPVFEELTRNYLYETASRFENSEITAQQADKSISATPAFADLRQRICCMVGCGLCYQALPLLRDIVNQIASLDPSDSLSSALTAQIAAVDGDIIQTLTAIQKTLFVPAGTRDLSESEAQPLQELLQSLLSCQKSWESNGQSFLLQRGLDATAQLLGPLSRALYTPKPASIKPPSELPPSTINETFTLDGINLPRIFTGLWQLSSPAWGSAPREKMIEHFSNHVQRGFTAFDMADHYGDAEIIFGGYRSSSAYSNSIFAATKYCVFHPMKVSEEAIRANVDQRCRRLSTESIDLLQFHWQFVSLSHQYNDDQYIRALQYLQQDKRVKHLGLCNFDTEHMQRVIDSGVKVVTNQVQFSLIDSRPIIKMAEVCKKHNIKLLTYGTLCGGLLAEKWLGQEPPDLYSEQATPSLRKYYTMIRTWGGWPLFQELLRALHAIAQKHGVTVSNVATRWVLDFPYVGAVIVGARMGVSEQSAVNLGSLGWTLDGEDRASIDSILQRSLRAEMFESMGDCGGEYR